MLLSFREIQPTSKTLTGLSILVFCLFLGIFYLSDNQAHPPPVADAANYSIPKQIRYSFTIHNTTNRLVKNGLFRTWAPVKQTAAQRCERIEASCAYRIVNDELGNQMLEFALGDVPPYATRLINISAHLLMSPISNPSPLNADRLQLWLDPEKYIESDHPDLTETARNQTADTQKQSAENIFNWVAGHVAYSGYVKQDRGALYAFSRQSGDCTAYMHLFTALCRAGRIPARGIAGYVVDEDSVLSPVEFHNWAEFYENGRWHPADPLSGDFMKDGRHRVAMRIIKASPEHPEMQFHRFQVIGEGLTATMNK
jgi:transglutaminase-like putative cysteine protease